MWQSSLKKLSSPIWRKLQVYNLWKRSADKKKIKKQRHSQERHYYATHMVKSVCLSVCRSVFLSSIPPSIKKPVMHEVTAFGSCSLDRLDCVPTKVGCEALIPNVTAFGDKSFKNITKATIKPIILYMNLKESSLKEK